VRYSSSVLPKISVFRTTPGDVFHVIHDTAYAPESFNPGVTDTGALRNLTRFAPVRDAAGKVVPYLYGGSSLDCAIFETIFHNVPVDAPDKFVDLDGCAQRGHGQVVPARDLKLADLTTDGLHRLKVSKAELIGSAPTDYLQTALCAQAIHHQYPDADGLLRVSRQPDRDRALMVFGDLVDESLSGRPVGGALKVNDALRQSILGIALRAGIEVS
jgi:hypothetical protein